VALRAKRKARKLAKKIGLRCKQLQHQLGYGWPGYIGIQWICCWWLIHSLLNNNIGCINNNNSSNNNNNSLHVPHQLNINGSSNNSNSLQFRSSNNSNSLKFLQLKKNLRETRGRNNKISTIHTFSTILVAIT
jgi:hypothetical protein